MPKTARTFILLLALALLTACGGRGLDRCGEDQPQILSSNISIYAETARLLVEFDVANPEKLEGQPIIVFAIPPELETVVDSWTFETVIEPYSNEWQELKRQSNLDIGQTDFVYIGVPRQGPGEDDQYMEHYAILDLSETYATEADLDRVKSAMMVFGKKCIYTNINEGR